MIAPVGCVKLLRATYVDSTSSTVTTVGLLVASGEAPAMSALNQRWTAEHLGDRTDLLPKAVAFPGTAAASFGDRQRGSWDVQVAADLPFVVYAVSGFADGRAVAAPLSAAKADTAGATSAPAQAGLGYAATGLNQIVDESGAPKGSLYFHFPGGKEQLVAESLSLASASLTELLAAMLAAAPTPAAALDGIVAYFAQQLESSQFAKGCPIATVALEQSLADQLPGTCGAAPRVAGGSARRDGDRRSAAQQGCTARVRHPGARRRARGSGRRDR
mgnify:CR=1 FL=1